MRTASSYLYYYLFNCISPCTLSLELCCTSGPASTVAFGTATLPEEAHIMTGQIHMKTLVRAIKPNMLDISTLYEHKHTGFFLAGCVRQKKIVQMPMA